MRIGIIGAGAVARRGHLPIYGTMPDVDVVGIADVDDSLAAKVAYEFKIPRHFSSGEELLTDDSIELVDICTPTQTHLEMVKIAAQRGKPILVEKPLATSLKDALEIQRLVNENGTKLCVVQNYRYSPAVIAVKERISRGYLGKLVTLHGLGLTSFPTHWTLNTWLYHQGGALYDFGPHLIDVLLWMKDFSTIERVYASGGDLAQGDMDFINYAVINIEFEDGAIATADISWVTGINFKLALDIYGTGGNAFLDVKYNVFSETHGSPNPLGDIRFFVKKMVKVAKGVVTRSYFSGADLYHKPLTAEITEFISSINGNREIPVPVEQGVMTIAVLEAAMRSIQQGSPVYIRDLLENV